MSEIPKTAEVHVFRAEQKTIDRNEADRRLRMLVPKAEELISALQKAYEDEKEGARFSFWDRGEAKTLASHIDELNYAVREGKGVLHGDLVYREDFVQITARLARQINTELDNMGLVKGGRVVDLKSHPDYKWHGPSPTFAANLVADWQAIGPMLAAYAED